VVQEAVVPPGGLVGPRALDPAGDRFDAHAATVAVLPADELRLDGSAFRLRADVLRPDGAVRLTEGVAPDDQRNGLLVVHRHAAERFANVPCRGERVRVAVGSLRIDVDQTHLYRAEWTGEFPVAAVALIPQPCVLGAPKDLVGLPDVLSSKAE